MTAQPGLGVTGNGVGVTTPIAHRLAQSGLVAKAGGTRNLIRPGLFYDGAVNIVTGTAGMSYDVAPFTAALTRGAGQGTVLLANDGTVNVPTTAAPGSNSRIDIVYVWQRDFAIDGTNSNPVIGVVQGSPAASPAAPSLAAFPGALELARITVPAGVTATNTGTTIQQTARYTAAAGGTIPVRNATELAAIGAVVAPGQLVYDLDGKALYQLTEQGGDMARVGGARATADVTTFQAGITPLTGAQRPRVNRIDNQVFLTGGVTVGSGSNLSVNILTVPPGFRPLAAGTVFIGANVSSGGDVYQLAITQAGVVSLPSGYVLGSVAIGRALPVVGTWIVA